MIENNYSEVSKVKISLYKVKKDRDTEQALYSSRMGKITLE